MLNVDLSNIWCSVTLPELLESEQEVANAHAALMDGSGADFLPWLDADNGAELERLDQAAQQIRRQSQLLVVVGSGSAVLGAQAALELLRGRLHLLRPETRVLFTGGDLSTQSWQALAAQLETQDFCVQIVDRDGGSLSTGITVRALRWMLERRYGTEKARERVFVTTDPVRGVLRRMSVEEGWTAFNLPWTLAGHESVLAPAAMLPLSVAGVDVGDVLRGAGEARRRMEDRSFENPAWLYASARRILNARGKRVEYLSAAEPDAWTLCRWWQRLFGGRACFGGDGLIPAAAELPAELEQLAGLLCDGTEPILQTILRFAPGEQKVPVEMDWSSADELNYLEGFTLDYVQDQMLAGVIQAGSDGGVPIITIDCETPSAASVGELLYFFELSSCLCAGMMGRDLYEDEPPAAWRTAAERLLGKVPPETAG